MMRILTAVAALAGGLALTAPEHLTAQTDLDAFMQQVVARRDDNWKKLQQYILDEREVIELRGPTRLPIWGERREYTWYIRDGFFVRSPLKFNGVEIADGERRKFEADYLRRQQERERRRGQASETAAEESPKDIDGLIRQTREPQFISSAYFLRFKFEEGKYALVGRETLDGREVLRVEYFPTRMFTGTNRRRNGKEPSADDKARDAEFRRLMNKVALVTLWVDPAEHQILKYDFHNLPLDFLPGRSMIRIDGMKAAMEMGQPFPNVWLPRSIRIGFDMSLAIGELDGRYAADFYDYKLATVSSKVR